MMTKYVSREAWGARKPRHRTPGALTDKSTAHWNGPTITVQGKTVWDHSFCAALVRGVQNFHMDARGWSDIAYNFVECPHGYTFEGRGLNIVNGGNGTAQGNRSSHAVMCLAGQNNPFSDLEKMGFKECVRYISEKTGAPNACKGHRDHKATECPGEERYRWVHSGMPVSIPKPPTHTPTPISEDDMILFIAYIPSSKTYYLVDMIDRSADKLNDPTQWINAGLKVYPADGWPYVFKDKRIAVRD